MDRRAGCILMVAWSVAVGAKCADAADSVRLWPTAVVTGEEVTLGDLCDLSMVDSSRRDHLAAAAVTAAPPPGERKQIALSDVHDALRGAGANLATLLVTGSTRCRISRPTVAVGGFHAAIGNSTAETRPAGQGPVHKQGLTLADAVRAAIEKEAVLQGGTLELQFGRTPDQVLALAEPEFSFAVHSKNGQWTGRIVPLAVDVLRGGKKVQTVELVIATTIRRPLVVARRAINQKATVQPEDVEMMEREVDAGDAELAGRIDQVIGLRARRFIPAGSAIRVTDLESVPLVKRGQVVEVVAASGGVEIRSAAKAMRSGALGEVIELRTGDRRGPGLSGVVVGPGCVRVGDPIAGAGGGWDEVSIARRTDR